MSFKQANKFLREGKLDEALEIYKKTPKDSPLYKQAQFNIRLIQNKQIGKDNTHQSNTNTDQHNSVALVEHNQPLVSVVMPVFNVAPYLDASILSVLDQTYSNIELIIVDDASTDNGMNIIRMHEQLDNRIKVVQLDFNTLGGAGIPSNIGISEAKGVYIAFADSDDILHKDAIRNLVEAAEENDAEIVIADFCNFNNETRVFERAYDKRRWSGLPLGTVFHPKEYPTVFSISPVPWRKLYKREFLENNNIRYPEGDYFYEDNPLHWYVMSNAQRVVLIDKEVAYHRMDREGQTMGADKYKLAAHFCHLNSILSFFENSTQPISDVFWLELLKRVLGFKWILKQVDNRRIEATFKKRIGELAKAVVKSSKLSNDVIIKEIPHAFQEIEEYSQSRSDVDLTIIIPVYNCADLIGETLESLTKFNNIKAEILIIDDGSTDDSLDICQRYASKYPNFYAFSQKNKGAGVARNGLIPLAIGRYTYFLDADDTIDVAALERAFLCANKNKSDLVLFKYSIDFYDKNERRGMFNSDQTIWDELLTKDTNDEKKRVAAKLINYPWNRMISTKLLHDENIFFGKTVVHNDVPYHWHSIISAKNIYVHDEVVCNHRKFEEREQITNIADIRRMMVLEAYRYTNHLLSQYEDFKTLLPAWKSFITHLLTWAESKIPESEKQRYISKRSEILKELNGINPDRINKAKETSFDIDENMRVGLYRIIGNNISGLHGEEQSINNLTHILEHESNFNNITKYFVLNRISNINHRNKLKGILRQQNAKYLEIEFDISHFKQIGYDFASLPDSYYWFAKKGNWSSIVCNTAVRNFKNAYLMNNNGARNLALKHGKDRFDWTMPWDGNCFLSNSSANELLGAMSDNFSGCKYILTPMQRAIETDIIDQHSVITNAIDEPQISFKKDSSEIFNENRVYGNQSKVELFKRLGYRGEAWDKLVNLYPWQELTFTLSPEQGSLCEASGVFRLYSGNTQAALDGQKRSHARSYGIIDTIDSMEVSYIAVNYDNYLKARRAALIKDLFTLAPEQKLIKLVEDINSGADKTINQLNSKDRVYGVIFAFSKNILKQEVAAQLDIDKHYYKPGIELSNVDKFCAVLNNLTAALLCSLVIRDFERTVKIKLDLVMLMNYYYTNENELSFNKSSYKDHISQLVRINKILLLEVFEYSFDKNFEGSLSVCKADS